MSRRVCIDPVVDLFGEREYCGILQAVGRIASAVEAFVIERFCKRVLKADTAMPIGRRSDLFGDRLAHDGNHVVRDRAGDLFDVGRFQAFVPDEMQQRVEKRMYEVSGGVGLE